LEKAKKLSDKWELLRLCTAYIEENEEWLIADRLERSYNDQQRQLLWEKEMRLKRVGEKKRKFDENLEKKIKNGEEFLTAGENDQQEG
jgi:hypothetical protein